jgi:hypothetical protein
VGNLEERNVLEDADVDGSIVLGMEGFGWMNSDQDVVV